MKRLALFVIATAVVVSGLSYYSGMRIERDLKTGMTALAEGSDFPGQISTTYERAKSELRFASANAPALTLEHRIAHGPIPWAGLRHGARPGSTWIESQVSLAGSHPAVDAFLTGVPPLRVRTRVGRVRGTSELYWPAFEGAGGPGNGKVTISELNGEIHFGGLKEEAYGSLQWGGMKMDTPLYSLEIAKLSGEFAYEDLLKTTLSGQSSFRLDSVSVRSVGQAVANLRDFTWTEQRKVDDGLMFLHSAFGIGSLSVMGFQLREGRLETELEKIDLSVWGQVRKFGKHLAQSSGATALAATAGERPAFSEAQTLELLRAFLAADPSLSVRLAAQVNGEALSATTGVHFGEAAAGAGFDPQALMQALDADLSLEIPATLLDAWLDGPRGSRGKSAQLRMLRDQGILRRTEAGAYVTRLQFRGGELRVNGVPYETFGVEPPGHSHGAPARRVRR
jgi:uncharacterized protein YdgA (DUF945 family)